MEQPIVDADGASLLRRIAAAPQPSSAAAALARVADWLDEIAGTAAGRTLQRAFAEHPPVHALVAGIAEYSPYLWDLARADPARLLALLQSDPDARIAAIIAEAAAAARASDEAGVMRALRRMKADAALLIALADIGGVWPVMRVTRALTELADAAVGTAVHHLLADAARRGRLHPPDPKRPEHGSGLIVLAMGKMGARELNYSSDIDLIVFYDAETPALAPQTEPATFYVRLTRALVKLLQERTADGYVFRTDLRLRPDPSSTHVAVSTAAALDYYESVGQNWERAALIKARACAGDLAAAEKLIASLSPFVWRKYLDFAAVADIHAMKRQIHAFRGHDKIAVEGHNVKLGRGGIREIEFFVQTQQLIAGGRYPQLRRRETLSMLAELADGGWIDLAARDEATAAYRFLRSVEHRLQMVSDEQTHTLPAEREALERFARFLGFPDRDAFAETLLAQRAAPLCDLVRERACRRSA
jgi:glutamate-ammonia-ligase adenylyltransferase